MAPKANGRSGGAAAGPAAGPGFAAAAALTRGMGDLSMEGAALDETLYEFKENNERQDCLDDIDDFERRLTNAAAPRAGVKPQSTACE